MTPLDQLNLVPTSDNGAIAQSISLLGTMSPAATQEQSKSLMDLQAAWATFQSSLAAAKGLFTS